MQDSPIFPLPQLLPLHQPPSEADIKNNLQKYSPFYKQAMLFDEKKGETLFYVAHSNFSSEKALKKLEAFDLFKDKKIVFVEFRGDKRGPVRDAGVEEGDDEGVHEQPRGNSAHFTVKVKNKGRYTFRELEISADGKCGIASSIVALKEILRGDIPPSPEVLMRNGVSNASAPAIEGDIPPSPEVLMRNGVSNASAPAIEGDVVESDSKNPFDALLEKIYKPKVVKDEEGKDKYEDDVTLHHCVRDGLTSESPELQPITGNLSHLLKERVGKLLTKTPESDWLEPKHVHEILTTNLSVNRLINQGQLQNISAGNIFSFHAAIPATRIAEEPFTPSPEVSSAPNADNQTLTRAGRPNEGMELEPDKTLKHEFRIIVLNILHEWIEGKDCEFSRIDEDDFFKVLIAKKLGDEYAVKIQEAFGGDKITFKSLLAIDEVEDQPMPLNRDDQLKKEREAFYSAPCGDGKKVFEKILDIAEKFCQDWSFTRDEHSKNEEILLEELEEVLKNFTNLSLDEVGQIKLASINSLIHELEKKHLFFFEDEIEYRLAFRNAGGGRSAQQGLSPARVEPDNTLFLASISPKARQAKPNYSYLDQANVGYDSKISQETFERAFTPGYSSNTQAFKMYTFSPDSINIELSERRVSRTQTPTAVASAQTIHHPAATGFIRTRAGDGTAQPAPAPTPPDPAQAEPAPAPPAPRAPTPPDPAQAEPAPAPAPRAHAPRAPTPPDPAQAEPAPAPAANPLQAKPEQDLDKFGELMETARVGIVEAFENLGKSIKKSCEEAREDLLKKVNEMEEPTKKPGNATGKQGDIKASDTPDNNILKPIFSALRSCLGERDK